MDCEIVEQTPARANHKADQSDGHRTVQLQSLHRLTGTPPSQPAAPVGNAVHKGITLARATTIEQANFILLFRLQANIKEEM